MWIETNDKKYINSDTIERIFVIPDGFDFSVKAYGIKGTEYILKKYSHYNRAKEFLDNLIMKLNKG